MKKAVSFILMLVLSLGCVMEAGAVDFTPSVERKQGYTLGTVEGEDGNEHDAVIKDDEGETYLNTDTSMLVLTPYSEKETVLPEEIGDALVKAKKAIDEATSVSALSASLQKELEKKKAEDPDYQSVNLNALVVNNLFDVAVVNGDRSELISLGESQNILFSMQTDLKPGDKFFMIINPEGTDEWKLITDYTLGEDGQMTLELDTLGVIAVLVPGSDKTVVLPSDPTSPQTDLGIGTVTVGNTSLNILLMLGAIFGAAGIALTARGLTVRRKEEDR